MVDILIKEASSDDEGTPRPSSGNAKPETGAENPDPTGPRKNDGKAALDQLAALSISDTLVSAPSINRWSRRQAFSLLVPLFDALVIMGSAFAARHVHYLFMPEATHGIVHALPVGILGALLLWIGMNATRQYRFGELSRPTRSVLGVLLTWSVCLVVMMALAYMFDYGDKYPRSLTLPWSGAVAILLTVNHIGASMAIRWATRLGIFRQRVAVVGATPRVMDLLARFTASTQSSDYDVVGIFDDRINRVPKVVAGIPVVGTVPDLISYCRRQLLDVIVIALPWAAEDRNIQIIRQLRELPVDISLVPDMDMNLLPPRGILWLGGMPTVLVSRRPLSEQQMVIKWFEDKGVALAALIVAVPIMLVAAILVKVTSKGPLLFTQDRFGFNGQAIKVLKSRTMYTDQGDSSGRQRTVKDDPRVTPVGRVMRRYSIDELPQIFNVLKGDMSIIGPRAHAVAMAVGGRYYYEAVSEYQSRHRVKPGITGWAQVNGSRGEVETQEQAEERLRLDIYYVDNWSILLDLKIIWRTARLIFRDPQAY
ncbi:MAG: undecaprenyl-phosphate glucose phosphotransferase [Rhodospirillum sp.]|nr:undecaprenyl-phosphate glucose phosphotransferase [Rhodospirillum sp.]